MKRIILFLALTACAWSQPTMPFANWKSAAVATAWHPLALGNNLKFAFEADSIIGKNDGDTLYHWRNLARASVGSQLYQLTASKKPIMRDSSGVKWVQFDGINDAMRTSDDTTYNLPYTIVNVFRTYSPASVNYPAGDDNATVAGGISVYTELYLTGTSRRLVYSDGSNHATNIEMWDDSLRAQIVAFNGASSSYEHRTANVTWSANFSVTGATLAGRSMGSARAGVETQTYAPVKMYAYYVYIGTLSADDKTKLWTYINQRWGL